MGSIVDDDDIDNVLSAALESLKLSSDGVWPSWITEYPEEPEHIIANLSHCYLPPECQAYLPFPLPSSDNQEIMNSFTAKTLNVVAGMPLFVCTSIPTPILACMLTGMRSRQAIDDCDVSIELLRRRYRDGLIEFDGEQKDYHQLESSRETIDHIFDKKLKKLMQERSMYSPHTRAWPAHVSTFTVFRLYHTVILTLLSLVAVDESSRVHREHINNAYNELCDASSKLVVDALNEPLMKTAVTVGQRQFIGRMNVFDTLVPNDIADRCIVFTRRALELAEHCIMEMINIPHTLQKSLVCTVQPALITDDATFVTKQLLHDQDMLIRSRTDYHCNSWANDALIVAHASTVPFMHMFQPYKEWIVNACVRQSIPTHIHAHRYAYMRRVLHNSTLQQDGDWYSLHMIYDTDTNEHFRVVNAN